MTATIRAADCRKMKRWTMVGAREVTASFTARKANLKASRTTKANQRVWQISRAVIPQPWRWHSRFGKMILDCVPLPSDAFKREKKFTKWAGQKKASSKAILTKRLTATRK